MRPVSLLAELLLGEVVRVSRNQLLLEVYPGIEVVGEASDGEGGARNRPWYWFHDRSNVTPPKKPRLPDNLPPHLGTLSSDISALFLTTTSGIGLEVSSR